MPAPDITDKYIVIRVLDPGEFDENSLYSVWIDKDKGIEELMGKKKGTDEIVVQSYLFDRNTWTIEEARKWVKEHKKTKAELLSDKRVFVTAKMDLCSALPKLSVGTKIQKLNSNTTYDTDKIGLSTLNDKYFYYVEGVHEGFNGNNHFFYADELTKSYKSASYQPIDWEHDVTQIIGFSLES